MKMVQDLFVAIVFVVLSLLATVTLQQQDCVYPPCGSVPVGQQYFYPNWDNCDTYWSCQSQRATLSQCPGNMVFNFANQTCIQPPTLQNLINERILTCNILINGISSLQN